MPSILVIGSASLDTLHIQGEQHKTIGGAGLYTALAAAASGARTILVAPKPTPMPSILAAVENHIEWIGPICKAEEMPRLEIAHHGNGKATLIGASWGEAAALNKAVLPSNLNNFDFVHIAALPSAAHQLSLLGNCREGGANAISCGTYAKLAFEETNDVRSLFQQADLFFMNENEANGLFKSVENASNSEGQITFITLDREGAIAIHQNQQFRIVGEPVEEVDPTGAGDTFCGTTLARLAFGDAVNEAATRGCLRAAHTVQHIGPTALI